MKLSTAAIATVIVTFGLGLGHGSAIAGAIADGPAASGARIFKKCHACHDLGKNRIGPNLLGVVGRPAASAGGFKYSPAMTAAGEKGLVWTQGNLVDYLANPKAYLKAYLEGSKIRNKMMFKLKDEQQRRDVVAYLESQRP